jgi:hypothetical protein
VLLTKHYLPRWALAGAHKAARKKKHDDGTEITHAINAASYN